MNNPENWEQLLCWWEIDMYGEPGSAKRKAHEFTVALSSIVFLKPKHAKSHSVHERKAIRRNYGFALMRILRAFRENDAEFFLMVADGLKQLREKEESTIETPLHCLVWTYWTYFKASKKTAVSTKDPPVPTKKEIIAQTKRLWAICRLRQMNPFFFIDEEIQPGLEADIAREIRRLPTQNWARLFKKLGLTLPHAKPGPKKRAGVRRQ